MTSTFDLEPDGDGTVMRYRTEIKLSGLLSHLGGAGLDSVAQRHAARTLDAVEAAI